MAMTNRTIASWVGLALLLQVPASATPKVEEVVVGPGGRDIPRHVSPAGLKLATVVMKGSRFSVLIDGVEGPLVDEVLNAAATVDIHRGSFGEISARNVTATYPVAFSPDLKRHAYAARVGDEIIVICDGKEVFRTKNMLGSLPRVQFLAFTPDSRKLYFNTPTTDTMSSVALWMDGQIGPPAAELVWPVFSADGSRYAYSASKIKTPNEKFVVVDGEVMSYAGGRPAFTKEGRLVVMSPDPADGSISLLVDGKTILKSPSITRYVLNPVTNSVAAIATGADSKPALFIDGNQVPGTEGAHDVIFSSDGKRWIVKCAFNGLSWVVIDGKRSADYAVINQVGFSADASKAVYVAEAGGKRFVVTEGVESPAFTHVFLPPIFSPRGAGVAFNAGPEPMLGRAFHVNGQAYPPGRYSEVFQFSDNGEHFAYLSGTDLFARVLVVDGADKSSFGMVPEQSRPALSGDGKHYACVVRTRTSEALLIDDKLVDLPPGTGAPRWLAFSSDGNHLFWWSQDRAADGKAQGGLYVDGERVAVFDANNIGLRNNLWELNDDGSLTLLGSAGEVIKRVRVTPSPERSVASILSDHEARVAQAAEAAAKAQAEKQAAAQKAEEEARLAREAAAAKREADLEARKQAREEAAAAREKARQERLEAQQKAKEEAARKKAEQQRK